jgi:MFS family permease
MLIRSSQAAVGFGVSYWVYTVTGDAQASALALLARIAPSILLSLYSGWISDIRNPLRMYAYALLGQWCCSALLAAYLSGDHNEVWILVIFLGTSSLIDSFIQAGYQRVAMGAIHSSDPKKSLLNGRVALPDSAAPLIGPLFATVVMEVGGLSGLFVSDAAISLLGVALVLAVFAKDQFRSVSQSTSRVSIWTGFREIWHDSQLRGLQLLFSSLNFLNGIGTGLLAAFVLGAGGASKVQYAAVTTAMAVGSLVGSALVSTIRVQDGTRYAVMATALIASAIFGRLLPGVYPMLLGIGFGLAARAATGPVSGAMNQSLWLDSIDRTHQGTIFGTRRLLAQGTYPLGVAAAAAIVPTMELWAGHFLDIFSSPAAGALRMLMLLLGVAELVTIFSFFVFQSKASQSIDFRKVSDNSQC